MKKATQLLDVLRVISLKLLHPRRYDLRLIARAQTPYPPDISEDNGAVNIIQKVEPFTMTSPERVFALIKATEYLVDNNVQGDFVECGVWRGGSSMAVALTLIEKASSERDIYLFDTYEGMPRPTEKDVDLFGGIALDRFQESKKDDGYSDWCDAGLDEVKRNLQNTQYPQERLHFIEGRVEDTLPLHAPEKIALLRLDTDWYESTLHELVTLYPKIVPGGVCILDDYGHWKGARQAVDKYFAGNKGSVLLNRIDFTGRLIVKPCWDR